MMVVSKKNVRIYVEESMQQTGISFSESIVGVVHGSELIIKSSYRWGYLPAEKSGVESTRLHRWHQERLAKAILGHRTPTTALRY